MVLFYRSDNCAVISTQRLFLLKEEDKCCVHYYCPAYCSYTHNSINNSTKITKSSMSLVMPSFSESSQQQKRLENERWMQFVGERTGTLRLWLQTHHFTCWVDKEFIQQELQWNWVTAYRDHTHWLNFNTYSIMRFFTPTGLCRMGSQSSLDDLNIA